MEFSKRERKLIELLTVFESEGKEEASLDEICERYYGEQKRPTNFRSSMASALRMLGLRLIGSGASLDRVSGRGRSVRGVYQFKGFGARNRRLPRTQKRDSAELEREPAHAY